MVSPNILDMIIISDMNARLYTLYNCVYIRFEISDCILCVHVINI